MIGSSAPYDIIRREDRCAATGRAFEPGDRQVAVLVELPGEEALSRIMYSESAWDAGARPESPAVVFGYWRRIAGDEQKPTSPIISTDELFDLFEQLADTDQDKQIAFRYLLALMLMRKRRLIYEGATPDTPGSFRVKARPGGHVFDVIDPGMDDDRVAEASEELGRVMQVEGDA